MQKLNINLNSNREYIPIFQEPSGDVAKILVGRVLATWHHAGYGPGYGFAIEAFTVLAEAHFAKLSGFGETYVFVNTPPLGLIFF